MSAVDPLLIPEGFQVTEFKMKGYRFLRIEWRGEDTWAVSNGGSVLDKKNKWVYEPRPSSRSDKFIADTRFTLEEAFKRATEIAKKDESLIREYKWYLEHGSEA